MKITLQKTVGNGEVFLVEVNVNEKDGFPAIQARMEPAYQLVDRRLLEQNTRLMNLNNIARSLGPEANMAIHQTLEILYGAREANSMIDGFGEKGAPDPRVGQMVKMEPSDEEVAGKADKLAAALEAVDAGK